MAIRTVKQLYEAFLVNIRKEQSPTLHLRDFNYHINDVISDVIRDIALGFEANQKSLDYLKGIKKLVTIPASPGTFVDPNDTAATPTTLQLNPGGLFPGGTPGSLSTPLPFDYRHFTGAVICYEATADIIDACYPANTEFQFPTKRLSADQISAIIGDLFLTPRYDNPYHTIIDNSIYFVTGDHPNVDIKEVQFQYLKTPQEVTLTQADAFNQTQDNSQVLEFDEHMNYEILMRLVQRIMERNGDPRTQSYTQVSREQPPADAVAGVKQQ